MRDSHLIYHVGTGQIFSTPANPKKYQVLVMTPRNVDKEAKDECTLAIDNQKLKPTANLRILGVNIDDMLSFTEHISDICKKVSKKIGC